MTGASTMSKLVKVASVNELSTGEGKVVDAEGHSIALFNVDGTYSAIDNTCTHVGGPLGEGALAGDIVTCPWLGAEFNVKTGECTAGPASSEVKSYTVKVDGDDVFVELN